MSSTEPLVILPWSDWSLHGWGPTETAESRLRRPQVGDRSYVGRVWRSDGPRCLFYGDGAYRWSAYEEGGDGRSLGRGSAASEEAAMKACDAVLSQRFVLLEVAL